MKKVAISGYYGFDNIGDDAMVETFSKYFKEKGIDLIVMSQNTDKTSKQYGVKAVDRFNIFQIVSAIRESDILISGGGTLLQDVTRLISIWYYLVVIAIAILFKKPVYVLFQGIGPINNKFNVWFAKKILSKVKYIALRDKKAYEEMKKLGFDMTNVEVATDLVFDLEVLEREKSKNLIKKYIPDYSEQKRYLGVAVRPWNNIYNEEKFGKLLDTIKKEYHAEIVFFPFHKKQDYLLSKDIQGVMWENSHIIYDDLKPSEVAGLMSLMNANIGVRLHSLVFAAITKVPVIGITYDPKVDGFLQDINMKPVCEYNNLDEEKIIKQIDKVFKGQGQDLIFNDLQCKKNIVRSILDKVIGDINGKS